MERVVKTTPSRLSLPTKPIMMKLLSLIPALVKNKYMMAFAAFGVIMLFLDKNDIFTTMARNQELRDLEKSKIHYSNEINELTRIKEGLTRDPGTIEKYARENYLMKRDNEDIFLVPEKPDGSKKK